MRSIDKIVLAWLVLIALVALVGNVSLAAENGWTSAEFLQIDVSARAAGLGGANSILAEGAEAASFNPAGLGNFQNAQFSVSHFAWYQDINLEHVAAAFSVNDRSAAAVAITYLGYGQIDAYDATGAAKGSLSAYDLATSVSFGYQATDKISIGLTGKYVTEKLADISASAMAVDVGVKFTEDRYSVSGVLSNFGTDLTYESIPEKLPTTALLGVAYHPTEYDYQIAAEYERGRRGEQAFRTGFEILLQERYYLRTGYNFLFNQTGSSFGDGLCFGLGLAAGQAEFDYAYSLGGSNHSDDLHRFTLKYSLGK
ncbi:MAG: PorV/PorQ family protein [candidate division Zixibacteria bacterium]